LEGFGRFRRKTSCYPVGKFNIQTRNIKEMPVIPINKVVDPKRIIGKKWRAEEEERHKGSLMTPPPPPEKKQNKQETSRISESRISREAPQALVTRFARETFRRIGATDSPRHPLSQGWPGK
jgi:hypothetical protein